MKPILEIQNISKKFKISHQQQQAYLSLRDSLSSIFKRNKNTSEDFWALKDINFQVQQGVSLGIIGKNGAGKSTLLKILSRITPPTSGKITSRGRIASLLEVGTGFHPELSGRENIFLNGSILGMKRKEIEKKFDEIIDFAGTEKFLDTPLKHYSSGMQLRLAFAVAAFLEPEILVIDEVLAVGDAEFQKKCLGKMEEVGKSGKTILFVSHNMQIINKLCQKAILLHKGQIQFSGKTEDVVNYYLEQHTESSACFSVSLPKDKGEMAGYCYKIIVEDLDGNLMPEIPVGQPWRARVFFRLNKPVKHFIIAMGISNMMDVMIRTTWSAPNDFPSGEFTALFTNKDIILSSGIYNLSFGLSSFERAIHIADNAASINISHVAQKIDDKRIIRTSGTGVLLNQMDVDIIHEQIENEIK
ncbi:MAG: polysaccharide ABC transporter ATP-binding protein [Bacteroidota bacterium]